MLTNFNFIKKMLNLQVLQLIFHYSQYFLNHSRFQDDLFKSIYTIEMHGLIVKIPPTQDELYYLHRFQTILAFQ